MSDRYEKAWSEGFDFAMKGCVGRKVASEQHGTGEIAMTDIELLPSSVAAFTEALKGERGSLDAWLEVNDEREVAAHVEAYARANVAHATAPLQAEIEALRAELAASKSRAERMEEALREVTAVAITVLLATHREETLAEFSTAELKQIVDASKKLWGQRVEHIYRRAWETALRDHDQEVGNG